MLSRLVCRRNSGANGSRKFASSGKGSGEAFGTRFLFMFPLYHKTNKVVLGVSVPEMHPEIRCREERAQPDAFFGGLRCKKYERNAGGAKSHFPFQLIRSLQTGWR